MGNIEFYFADIDTDGVKFPDFRTEIRLVLAMGLSLRAKLDSTPSANTQLSTILDAAIVS